jgi:Mg2+ and Co2+ transporter CorA
VRQDWLEEKLLAGLQAAILRSDAIEYAITACQQEVAARLENLQDDLARANERKATLETELGNLISAIATCGPTPALTKAISEREGELRTITEELLNPEAGSMSLKLDDLREFVTQRLAHISELLNTDVARAKAELRQNIDEIRMQPSQDHYVASGNWYLLGNQDLTRAGEGMRVRMVAGGGFEPPIGL